MLRGEPVDTLSRELGVEIYRLEQWREKSLLGIDAARKGPAPPFTRQEVVGMSREVSPTTGKPYGVQRVCTTCQFPRPALYAQEQRAAAPERSYAKRGPKPARSDEHRPDLVKKLDEEFLEG